MKPPLAQQPVRACLLVAALSAGVFLFWQLLTVQALYEGNWTALFCAGDRWPPPAELRPGTYLWKQSDGYDGQFYRYVAHDPFLKKAFWRSIDDPLVRYRRILVPGLAWALAAGRGNLTDGALILVNAGFVFLGAWWLSRYSSRSEAHPGWGFLFLLMPATLVCMQRLIVDVALAALCAGFLYFAAVGSALGTAAVLAAACLARETGFLLVAAACAYAVWRRRWGHALLYAATVLPALLWYLFLAGRLPQAAGTGLPTWMFRKPLVGIFMRMLDPVPYPFPGLNARIIQALDTLALAGVLLAIGLAVWGCRRPPLQPAVLAALAFAALAVAASAPGFWVDVNGWSRAICPLYLFVGVGRITGATWWRLVPIALVDLRIAPQFVSDLARMIR